LTGDEHAKAANKMNLAAVRELLFCTRGPRRRSDGAGGRAGGGRLLIPLIGPIRPGIAGFCKPQDGFAKQNSSIWLLEGSIKTFYDKFRRECLGREMFYPLRKCQVVIGDCRQKFNEIRPHRSLGMHTPKEFSAEYPPPRRRANGGPWRVVPIDQGLEIEVLCGLGLEFETAR
jgi:hypothetical protein